ncbi:MAG TPA: 1,4-alpha-glucan branching protein domain-containing protein [Pyrinomonadaceae bacterium]|jgi:1,4-alpha-glucan branching enzyme
MQTGFFSLILHAHLPFVRHPEHAEFFEEDWLYEAITEVYLPLAATLARLADEGARPRLTVNLSPTLCEMLTDQLLRTRYTRHLDNLLALAEKELVRTTREQPQFHHAARMYDEALRNTARLWHDVIRHDLVGAFGALQRAGVVELITCGATHGFLPLISTEQARRAQIQIAVANYEKHFRTRPRGIWLPECAYAAGVDSLLAEAGLEYFFADAHAVLYGTPRPRYGVFAPVRCPAGPAVFARDMETSQQVWSSIIGYPGDPEYREFYRDVGWDAPYEYLRPHLHADGARRPLGLKYYRVTSREVPLEHKQPYVPERARGRARVHAEHFVSERIKQAARLRETLGGHAPLIVSPYDAELFGHWWYEGPQFLDFVFQELHARRDALAVVTPGDYLDLRPHLQAQRLSPSSWGADGYYRVWLNEGNAWMYPHQRAAETRMTALATRFPAPPDELTRRALNQAARELLLAEASDWAFQIYQGTTVEYATRRFRAHIRRFNALADQLERGQLDAEQLGEVEHRDNLFPELDYRVYADR